MNPLAEKLRRFAITILSVDGHDPSAIRAALDALSSQPKRVILNTIKGNDISFIEKQMKWHYLPFNEEHVIAESVFPKVTSSIRYYLFRIPCAVIVMEWGS
jgi:transketolase